MEKYAGLSGWIHVYYSPAGKRRMDVLDSELHPWLMFTDGQFILAFPTSLYRNAPAYMIEVSIWPDLEG